MFKTFVTSVAVGFASFMLIQPANAGMLLNGQESNGLKKNGARLNGQETNGLRKNGQEQNGRGVQGSATGTAAFAIDGIELPPATR